MINNNILKLLAATSFLSILACEEPPLDREIVTDDNINFIKVDLDPSIVLTIDPEDDSALPPIPGTFVDLGVTFSSTTPDELVESRLWSIPQPCFGENTPLNTQEIMSMEPVPVKFDRNSYGESGGEFTGLPITLYETLKNGQINRFTTNIPVRQRVNASFAPPIEVSLGSEVGISSGSLFSNGLSTNDTQGNNQSLFIWTIPSEPTAEFRDIQKDLRSEDDENSTENQLTLTDNMPVFVTFNQLGNQPVKLKVIRNWPLKDESDEMVQNVFVTDEPLLLPGTNEGNIPVRVAANGNEIILKYNQPITVDSSIDVSLFSVDYEVPKGTNIPKAEVSSVRASGNNLILSLSESIPSFVTSITTTVLSETGMRSQDGVLRIARLNEVPAITTGSNIFAVDSEGNDISSFEDPTSWSDSNPEFGFTAPPPNDEIKFTTERALIGEGSILWETTTNPSGLGATLVEDSHGLEVEKTGTYEISFWVFVESAEASSQIDFFYLDNFATIATASLSTIPQNQWVEVSGTRDLSEGFNLRTTIRVLGNAKVYVDALDVRIADDGL